MRKSVGSCLDEHKNWVQLSNMTQHKVSNTASIVKRDNLKLVMLDIRLFFST